MPVSNHLLERAHQLINANQLQNAELVLDAVVRVDPQNVGAWKAYLQIHQNQNDLDWLKERLLKTKELSEVDKNDLINYYHYLTQQPNGFDDAVIQTSKAVPLWPEEKDEIIKTDETIIRFELINMIDYSAGTLKKDLKTRPRQRAVYTTFLFDIASGAFNAMAHNPFVRKIPALIWKTISIANDLVKNPKDTYAGFSKSPQFKKNTGIALLIPFVIGVRLIIASHLLGYVFLGIFVIGNGWWLLNFGSPYTNQNRVYLHENKINLTVIKDAKMDQEQLSDEEDFEETIE